MLGAKGKKKQQRETSQGKVANRVMEWEKEAGFRGGGGAVRSFCPAQPVDFRQEKTEMVYSENALSAQFHPQSPGDSRREGDFGPFSRWGVAFCSPLFVLMSVFFPPRSVRFTVFLSSHALPSTLYRQLLINSQRWLSYFPLALHLPHNVLSLILPPIYPKQRKKNGKNLFCWKAIHLSQF